jgi:hypothetical protein
LRPDRGSSANEHTTYTRHGRRLDNV